MTANEIPAMRLMAQAIGTNRFKTPQQVVSWMGAMQAQDFNMAKWAIGIRIAAGTEHAVDAALSSGKIIRTHVLRPTWHFVAPADIHWMLELSRSRILAQVKTRHKQLGLTAALLNKAKTLLEKSLSNKNHLTRDEVITLLNKSKIPTNDSRASHILFAAELDGLICSGKSKNKKLTYALLNERVPSPKLISHDEALAKLAVKYFSSHGPATIADFSWWSGLSLTEAKKAAEMCRKEFTVEKIESSEYWYSPNIASAHYTQSPVLLPAFDEFIISYKDRSAVIPQNISKKIISNNGIFWPVILLDGKIAGLWSRVNGNKEILIKTEFFGKLPAKSASLLKEALETYSHFAGKKVPPA
jgi:hypothetical protein